MLISSWVGKVVYAGGRFRILVEVDAQGVTFREILQRRVSAAHAATLPKEENWSVAPEILGTPSFFPFACVGPIQLDGSGYRMQSCKDEPNFE